MTLVGERLPTVAQRPARGAPDMVTPATRLTATDYARTLTLVDTVAVLGALLAGLATLSHGVLPYSASWLTSLTALVTLGAGWLIALTLTRSRHRALLGRGPTEYQRVFDASWTTVATAAIADYVLDLSLTKSTLGVMAGVGVSALLLGRFAARQWLHRQRAVGRVRIATLVVGREAQIRSLANRFRRANGRSPEVVGACVPADEAGGGLDQTVPVLGDLSRVAEVAQETGVELVVVASSDVVTAEEFRRWGWELERSGVGLAVASELADPPSRRTLLTLHDGVPLIHVDAPRFNGLRHVVKAAFDWGAAALIVIAIAPVMLTIALLVKVTSPGNVFYTQERVGKDGRPFRMLKFRSMVDGADRCLDEVLGDAGVRIYFKCRNDPRVTPLGRFLRRHSLDELPQLLNVLKGEMSLVGPRPQVEREVAQYDRYALRRLLVRPGCTGLWQVSGRSDVPAREALVMDVRYAENWSLVGDLLILARTVKVILTGEGAY
ncbi:sugar transferase [Georgenia yuyongxinii]|uniref:Sugar transferase n=1 Tax=Georgenia yuyongxinii TaxID=2589797 RepID=A0A5B8C1H6_9MICO|nr:sugar transferase [Georgenia yuyongxinii]QDC23900.1 sugar transferase [Georgenia yuyongxinii]